MLYGFTGPSRSGKTTLARDIAEELGIHFHATTTTATAKAHGYDPVAPMSLADRVDLQHILLKAHLSLIKELPRPAIVDRTPIDNLAYLLCEFHMQSAKEVLPQTLARVVAYQQQAMDGVANNYDMVFKLGQLDHYHQEADKPDDNKPYHSHFEFVVEGILSKLGGSRLNHAILRTTDYDQRRDAIHDLIVKRMDTVDHERKTAAYMQ